MIQTSNSYGFARNNAMFAGRAHSSEGQSKVDQFQDVLTSAYSAVSQDEQQFAQTLKAWSARRTF